MQEKMKRILIESADVIGSYLIFIMIMVSIQAIAPPLLNLLLGEGDRISFKDFLSTFGFQIIFGASICAFVYGCLANQFIRIYNLAGKTRSEAFCKYLRSNVIGIALVMLLYLPYAIAYKVGLEVFLLSAITIFLVLEMGTLSAFISACYSKLVTGIILVGSGCVLLNLAIFLIKKLVVDKTMLLLPIAIGVMLLFAILSMGFLNSKRYNLKSTSVA